MTYRDEDRQTNLFSDEDTCDISDEIPPEERARLKFLQQQSQRALELNSQLGPYFHANLAYIAEERLVARVIKQLKSTAPGVMAGEGAANLWDEICVGLYNDSSLTQMYSDYIYRVLIDEINNCLEAERIALWLTTYSGQVFLQELPATVAVPGDIPFNAKDVANNTLQTVLNEAMDDESPWVLEMKGY